MEYTDLTGKPISPEDFEEAIEVVSKFFADTRLMKVPELMVQLPNIRRCLQQGLTLTRAMVPK